MTATLTDDRASARSKPQAGQLPEPPPDLRLVLPSVAAWLGVLLGTGSAALGAGTAAAAAIGVAGTVLRGRRQRARPRSPSWVVVAALCCLAAGAAAGALRVVALRSGPVPALAADGASLRATARLVDDPQPGRSSPGRGPAREYVTMTLELQDVLARGRRTALRTPVLAIADPSWRHLLPGTRVELAGRLSPAAGGRAVAAVLRLRGSPVVVGGAGRMARATEPLREALRRSVADLPAAPRGLVPALVDGDESALPEQVREDFRTTGLTHLTAVSGANVAITLAFVVGIGRWLGVRGLALPVLGAAAVLGFVALARPEPSVLRAAAMGLVAVAGLSAGGRRRGVAALGAAVVVLVLVDPWLGRSYGFALSVLATGGILVLGPPWRAALGRWLPRLVAEAVVVPLAAQVVCTPVIAMLSNAVSLAALPANLLSAPAVAPATVLGVLAAVIGPLAPPVARVAGWLAGQPAGWIAAVASHGAALPGAAIAWPGHGLRLLTLVAATAACVVVLPWLLRQRWTGVVITLVLVLALVRPLPRPGWPPERWVLVACDVGQGDALVLSAGSGAAVVVDAGPDARLVDQCLRSLGVTSVPVVVLTHFHADHVDGLPGVLDGRRVGRVLVGPLDDPPGQAAGVRQQAAASGVPVTVAHVGEQWRVGALTWEVLWPRRVISAGSLPNNASLVLRVRAGPTTLLLTGDVEPEAQRALMATDRAALGADVLKVPHHGSVHQDPAFLAAVGARLDIVSVGVDNDYGHPSRATLRLLGSSGARVERTDDDGAVAVVREGDALGVVELGPTDHQTWSRR